MKAISLWQPWATLVTLGLKRIETRSWSTRYRGPILIHAAKKWTESQMLARREIYNLVRSTLGENDPRFIALDRTEWPIGAYLCVVEIQEAWSTSHGWVKRIDAIERAAGDFSTGRFGWLLGNVRRLDQPIAARGKLNLYDPPPEIVASESVQAALWAGKDRRVSPLPYILPNGEQLPR